MVANYLTEFVIKIDCVSVEAKEWAEEQGIAVKCERSNGKWVIHIDSDDVEGDVDAVTNFMQGYLQQFEPGRTLGFEWANTCTHKRPDAFGGGFAVVTAVGVQTWDTAYLLGEKKAEAQLALDNKV